MTETAFPKEVMAAAIAHDLKDGQWVEVGANLPIPRAGALLGHLNHGPNMTVMIAMTKAYLRDTPVIGSLSSSPMLAQCSGLKRITSMTSC
jgi:glutaconate CoA-transferase subunit B